MYVFMCIPKCSSLQELNVSTTAIASPRTSQHREASTSPNRTITKLLVLCARSGYKVSFEACPQAHGLRSLVKHNSSTALSESSRKCHSMALFSFDFTRLLHLGPSLVRIRDKATWPFFGLAVVVPPLCWTVAVMTKLIVTTGNWVAIN